MNPNADITAVIVAGGLSSRMGEDKALLLWRERPFVAHIVDHLRPRVATVAINTNAAAAFAPLNLPLLEDSFAERRGPLAGILTALDYSATTLTLIVPCDNPLLSPQLIERLQAAFAADTIDLAYARVGDDHYYLYALLRSDLRARLRDYLRGGDFAVRHWYATLKTRAVDFSDQPQYFRNINCAEDLAQFQQL